jgi:sugar/nucleoside kinase (ribokinase family)
MSNESHLPQSHLPQSHVVVVGSTMIDMVAYTNKVPQAGETVIGEKFALGFGGKGANQATMARRFGIKVSMVNTLGDDVFGDTTLTNFQEQGIDTTFVYANFRSQWSCTNLGGTRWNKSHNMRARSQ